RCRPRPPIRRSLGRISGASLSWRGSTDCVSSRWERARTIRSPPRRARRSFGSGQSCTGASNARPRNGPVRGGLVEPGGSPSLADAKRKIAPEMGFADVWNRTLVYFGIAEEDDWDEEGNVTDDDLQRTYAERPHVRRLAPRRRER